MTLRRRFGLKRLGAPNGLSLLGLLPWAWAIPLNQYFWDDWAISGSTSLREQFDFWSAQAKHPLNPFVYFILLPLGPWVFHLLTVVAAVVIAGALQRVVVATRFADETTAIWVAPIAIAMPVFHARLSIATFEYSVALAALLVAWVLLFKPGNLVRLIITLILLAYAIAVPSLAVVFPLIWFTVSLAKSGYRFSKKFVRNLLMNSYLLLVPPLYALVFQLVLNPKNKFKRSEDGLTDFNNDLIRLSIVCVIVLVGIYAFRKSAFRIWWRICLATMLAYLALFPYFAVGYKPLYDFLPWRMRDAVKLVARDRLSTTSLVLIIVVTCTLLFTLRWRIRRLRGYALLTLGSAVFFGSATAALGPMDWESRHWLIAWPALTLIFVALLAAVGEDLRKGVAIALFAALLASSTWTSREYFLDSLKQHAFVSEVRRELASSDRYLSLDKKPVVVVVEFSNWSEYFNARFRKFRPYEWWGLIAKGLNIDPRDLKLLEPEDPGVGDAIRCDDPVRSVEISPTVVPLSGNPLLPAHIQIELDPQPIVLCDIRVKVGWPRDP